MAQTQTLSKTEQRTAIAKFRNIAETVDGAEYAHERIRKTKAHPVEENFHRLIVGGAVLAVVATATGQARWTASLAKRVRSAR